ncbi:unnamed protein product [Lampetra fluviatilis]
MQAKRGRENAEVRGGEGRGVEEDEEEEGGDAVARARLFGRQALRLWGSRSNLTKQMGSGDAADCATLLMWHGASAALFSK